VSTVQQVDVLLLPTAGGSHVTLARVVNEVRAADRCAVEAMLVGWTAAVSGDAVVGQHAARAVATSQHRARVLYHYYSRPPSCRRRRRYFTAVWVGQKSQMLYCDRCFKG